MAIEKIQILGAVFELPAKQHCQSILFDSKLGQIGQIGSALYQVAGSSKMAPRIFIFSIVLVAEYLSYLKSIETHARAFFAPNILSIATVPRDHIYTMSAKGLDGWV